MRHLAFSLLLLIPCAFGQTYGYDSYLAEARRAREDARSYRLQLRRELREDRFEARRNAREDRLEARQARRDAARYRPNDQVEMRREAREEARDARQRAREAARELRWEFRR